MADSKRGRGRPRFLPAGARRVEMYMTDAEVPLVRAFLTSLRQKNSPKNTDKISVFEKSPVKKQKVS